MTDSETQVQALWMSQPRDEEPLSLDRIRARAERFEAKTQRWRNTGFAAGLLVVLANVVETVLPDQHMLERAGSLLMIAAVAYLSYEYRKHARLLFKPEARGTSNCVDFYRARLSHERDLASQSSRYLLPFVPGVSLSLFGGVLEHGPTTARVSAVAAGGVALFLAIASWNAYTARKLQREVDALDAR